MQLPSVQAAIQRTAAAKNADQPATSTAPPANATAAAPQAGHRYEVVLEVISWEDAEARCERMGGYLACIGSAAEDAYVMDLIQKRLGANGVLGGDNNKFWLGGRLVDNRWAWVTGEPFNYQRSPPEVDPQRSFLRHAGSRWLTAANASRLIGGFVIEWNK